MQDINPAGAVQSRTKKASELSASGVWNQTRNSELLEDTFQHVSRSEDLADQHSAGGEMPHSDIYITKPTHLKRRMLREETKKRQKAKVIKEEKETDRQTQPAAIERSKEFDSIWRKESENLNSDSNLKLMRNQIIMEKVYASIAKAKNETDLYTSLIMHSRNSISAIGEATLDAELNPSALDREKEICHALPLAKNRLHDCRTVARKLRVMIQSAEVNINAQSKRSTFLTQLATKAVPKELHCLHLLLTTDYYLRGYRNKKFPFSLKLEDPLLYHYAVVSDNVLATSVVVNLAVLHGKQPPKHVFHIVTDKTNFAAMKMWFLVYPPAGATIQVENVDNFTWLNSSYCPILRQLESARTREYYFKAQEASSFTAVTENFDLKACCCAFGMSIFYLKEWRHRDITGVYRRWQNVNDDGTPATGDIASGTSSIL